MPIFGPDVTFEESVIVCLKPWSNFLFDFRPNFVAFVVVFLCSALKTCHKYVPFLHVTCYRTTAGLPGERLVALGPMQQIVWYRRDDTETRSAEARAARRQGVPTVAGDQVVRQRTRMFAQLLQLVGPAADRQHNSTSAAVPAVTTSGAHTGNSTVPVTFHG
jgi:hypothetical protein